MKVITCAGYYRTGSSAITDLFSEFDNVKSIGNAEIRLLQDPYGISNLETNIIEHPHRHNTSHAIKQFLKAAKFENGNLFSKRYRNYFGDSFMRLTEHYVDQITKCKCNNHWRYDAVERGDFFYMINALVEVLYQKTHNGRRKSLIDGETAYYSDIEKEEFYRLTKEYMNSLFAPIAGDSEYLMIDQLAAPTDPQRYINYVDNLYIIIIDRDPRDLFILENQVRWGVIPYKDVEDFCEWYKITRKHRQYDKYDENRVTFVHFEDLVYNYENTLNKLIELIGTNETHHVKKKEMFNPSISKKGTCLINVYPEFRKQVNYIEKHLSSYLYDFSGYNANTDAPSELYL